MKRFLCVILCIFIFCCSTYANAENTVEVFDRKVKKAFKDYDVIGASFVVYHKNQKIAEYHYGYADKRNAVKVNSNTKFKIASITKMVSAVGLMKLVEQGKVSLDDDIGSILGYRVRNPKYPDCPITIRMLLSHTSSIIDSARFAHARGTLEDMIGPNRVNDNAFSVYRPGSKYKYSNFGFGIIGSIIENASGQSVQSYMHKYIFNPLNIDAGFNINELKQKDVAARYYNGQEAESVNSLYNQSIDCDMDAENKYNITVGKLLISANDLSKILIALCGNGFVNGIQLLQPDSIEYMREYSKAKYNISKNTPYAIGIEKKTDIIENVNFYGHQGIYYSAYCDAFFDPLNNITIVLLTNGMKIVRINRTNALARQLIMLTYQYMLDTSNPYIVNE